MRRVRRVPFASLSLPLEYSRPPLSELLCVVKNSSIAKIATKRA